MIRREFLTRIAAGMTTAGTMLTANGRLWACSETAGSSDRIAISTWSLHNYFKATRDEESRLPGKVLSLLDVPAMMAERYNVRILEIPAPHFDSTTPAYLGELKEQLEKVGARVINIPVDIEEIWNQGGLSDPDAAIRGQAVEASQKWIDVAAAIGSPAVRCDPGKMKSHLLSPTVASYRTLAEYGKSKGVHVVIENHGGVGSEHPEELVRLFKEVNNDYLGVLPDFANFPNAEIRRKGLALLFPYARVVCHAKGLEFDPQGNETQFDFPECISIARRVGFQGVYSVEFEGPGDPYEGIQRVLNNLRKLI